jgi:hypothetical protein
MGFGKKSHKKKWSKYKESAHTDNIVKRADDTVGGMPNLAQNIFDSIGADPAHLKGAFGRPIDSTGKTAKYGGIGESGGKRRG